MPRLNGKFVSQETYDAAMAAQEETVSDEFETAEEAAEAFEEATEGGRKRGPRPTTVYKRAVNDRTAAEVKLIKARNKLAKFDNGRDELIAAVEAAEADYVAAEEAVNDAAENL